MREEQIFHQALEQAADQRAGFLATACGADVALRQRVEVLLQAQANPGSFLQSPVLGIVGSSAIKQVPLEKPGTQLGPYKILQQIGEGGMGVVYMAEQSEPVQRRVALKIIKPGMDSRQVIARFEAEKQALALMDHANIARVLDAGTTEQGRPYFVMELVHGVPITKYCDDNRLTPRQRLELFVPVCQAVQHAHQKGIIHRDIKPSNVMVTLYDGKPVPKVIDFGVAKATEQRLTEQTLFTQYGTMVGTLEYMSPEQAEMSALGVDTRSDIYSLGVLLYELLTGSTPLTRQQMKEAAYGEILRLIKEEEPPRPSTRLSESGDSLASISALRHTEPAKLSKLLRGELDWIVMKTLEKDRNRRYETASGFAADVQRYLNDEPVQACPPSAAYRLRKLVRRNKGALVAASLLVIAVLIAVSGIGWAVRDRSAREAEFAQERANREAELNREREARKAKVAGQIESILTEVDRLEKEQKWPEALAWAQRAEPALATGDADAATADRARRALADLQLVHQLEDIRALGGAAWVTRYSNLPGAQADQEYSTTFRQAEIDIDALPVSEAVRRITARGAIAAALLPALDDWLAVRCMGKNLAVQHIDKDEASIRRLIEVLDAADSDPWRQRVREAMVRRDQSALASLATSAELDRQSAGTLTLLYSALWASGKHREQELILRRAQWKYPADFWVNLRLGTDLAWRQTPDDVRDGIGFIRAAIAIRPESAHALMILGSSYEYLGQLDQAAECFGKAIELAPNYAASYCMLGQVLDQKGRYEEAIAALEQSIKLCRDNSPRLTHPYALLSMIHSNCPEARFRNFRRAAELAENAVEIEPQASNNWTALGIARYRENQWQEASTALNKSLHDATDSWGGAGRCEDAINWFFLAMCYHQLGEEEEARLCYATGGAWMEQNHSQSAQLTRFRREAEELLGPTVDSPAPPEGNLAKAKEVTSQATVRTPDPAEAEKVRAAYFARQEAKAEEEFSHAIELEPERWETWSARAFFYFNRRRWDRAAADFSEAIELAPQVHTNWWHRGHAYIALAEWDKAAADFGKASEDWADGGEGRYWRAVAYAQLGQLDNSMADLQQARVKGFKNLGAITSDLRFAPLAGREDFRKLVEDLEQNEK